MRRVGFFGGTFDPIHCGHLNLAIHMLENCNLDEILFCPTSLSPHKESRPPKASKQHRLAMTALVIEEVEQFSLLDWEAVQEGPSFTIDTIRALIQASPDTQFHLLLGEDALQDISLWKEPEELLSLAPPLVGVRSSASLQKGLVPVPMMEISSTAIRERLRFKKYCGHWVPAKVLDYIRQNRLYSSDEPK